ncbi:MAG: lytic transglycosylase domain-containing protein [Sandarakinorhabdus sp.]|nr:lytic transglycosylase domain-containing protein [Sandarakinorhabdus sp.]
MIALLVGLGSSAAAQMTEATRSLYTARLADNAAGRYTGFSAAPLIGAAQNTTLDTIVTWDRLRRDSYKGRFAEYAAFLRGQPDWPQGLAIRRLAEKSIDESVSAPDRIAFFKQFLPLSALAKLRLAEALLSVGRGGDARTMARDAWDSAGLDQIAETQLLALFDKDLTPADHIARADRLLWSNQTTAASRLLPKLDMNRRLWLLARIAMRVNSTDAVNRLAGVPNELRDETGLVLDRALWLRRNGDLTGAQALLSGGLKNPGSAVDPEMWLKTRLDFARQAWRAGDHEIAYRIASRHDAFAGGTAIASRPLVERQAFIDSEFLAGWLALRKLGRPAQAIGHFRNIRLAALTPLSQTRADYWTGRAAEAAGKSGDAKTAYEAAASHFDYFYGQLATERLARPLVVKRVSPPAIKPDIANNFRADPLVRAAFALGDIGDRSRQATFLRALADRAVTLPEQALVAGLAKPLDRPDLGVFAGKAARADGELALLDAAFPMLDLPANLGPRWTMIHAITRQESQFDRSIVSSANAQGLMQLLPGTAAEQAGKLGMEASTARLTSDPVYNVTLGSAYFARLKENFAGSHVLAVAGYNAGPGNVRKFLAANGDPRGAEDVIDWIEAIPLSETRNYVQRVLENAVVYDLLRPQTSVMPTTNRLSAYLGKSTPG